MIKKLTILFIMFSIATFTACGIDLNGDSLKKLLNGAVTGETGKWDQAKWDSEKWGE